MHRGWGVSGCVYWGRGREGLSSQLSAILSCCRPTMLSFKCARPSSTTTMTLGGVFRTLLLYSVNKVSVSLLSSPPSSHVAATAAGFGGLCPQQSLAGEASGTCCGLGSCWQSISGTAGGVFPPQGYCNPQGTFVRAVGTSQATPSLKSGHSHTKERCRRQ